MGRASKLPETRLAALYDAGDFGGEKTMRAKVIRELIDEIRLLRSELEDLGTASQGREDFRDMRADAFRDNPER